MLRVSICPTSPANFKALLYPLHFTKDAGVLLFPPCEMNVNGVADNIKT